MNRTPHQQRKLIEAAQQRIRDLAFAEARAVYPGAAPLAQRAFARTLVARVHDDLKPTPAEAEFNGTGEAEAEGKGA